MARKQTLDAIVALYQKLGGNLGEVLGTKTNINFLGKGKSPELMLDMNINTDALGVLPRSKAVDELKNSIGYAVSGKLNDIQANKLLSNMQKMDDFYNPPAPPANITDMATRTRNLDQEGLMSLRQGIDLPEGVDRAETILPTGAGLEAVKSVKNFEKRVADDLVNKVYDMAGVLPNAKPVVRANARDFLNRIKNLSDEPGNTTLSDVMEIDDFKFMTEGGGGPLGDPFLLVQKYFGPRVASAVAQLKSADEIQKFAENLVKVKDAKGNTVTSRFFNPETVDPGDFEFADGGRVPFFGGGAARMLGKASFEALKKYGIEGRDVSRLFGIMSADKTMVGPEKTAYFKQLYKVLKNPDDFPDAIRDIQIKLGIDIGLKRGGLAGILEV